MDVRLPDGTIIQNVPDNISKAELTNKLIAAGYAKSLGGEAPDPTSPGLRGVLEGVGQGMHSIWQGVNQRLGRVSEEEVARTREIDAPLLNTTRGAVGSYLGQALPAIGASLVVPGAGSLAGASALGGAIGATQPTVAGEDAASNVAKSALFGAGGQMLGKALLGPIANKNAAPRQDLINTAQQKYGIELPASTRTGNKPLAYLESQLASTPGGGRMADLYQRGGEQYAKAVMGEAGAPGQLATTANLAAAKKATGSAYEELWSRNMVKADSQFIDDLIQAKDVANRSLTPEKSRVVQKQIDNVLTKVRDDDTIDGSIYQMFLRPEIRSVASGDSSLKEPLKMVQRALDKAAFRSVSGADADALKKFNYQYAVQNKLEPKVGAAEARGGTFTPSAVQGAAGDMPGNIGELARIGPLLREPPQSGTAPRAVSQYMMSGIPAASVGGAYGYSEGGGQGALAGAGMGLLAPFMASRAMTNPAMQAYLSRGLLPAATQRQQALIGGMLRGGAPGLPLLIDAPQ